MAWDYLKTLCFNYKYISGNNTFHSYFHVCLVLIIIFYLIWQRRVNTENFINITLAIFNALYVHIIIVSTIANYFVQTYVQQLSYKFITYFWISYTIKLYTARIDIMVVVQYERMNDSYQDMNHFRAGSTVTNENSSRRCRRRNFQWQRRLEKK